MKRKFRVVKRNGRWYFSRPSCPAGPHFCISSVAALFEPAFCSHRDTLDAALEAVAERLKWDMLNLYRFR